MDAPITIMAIMKVLAMIVSLAAGIAAIITIYKYITSSHDRMKKWDKYDAEIKSIKKEQCMLTYCMMATLDGLGQLGCNGKVTEAKDALGKYLNKEAHDQNEN